MNWKVGVGVLLVAYLVFLAYVALEAESAVGDTAGSVFGELGKVWDGVSGSANDLSNAAQQLGDIYDDY